MLILFDIDGTLLRSEGAGMAAMVDAGRAIFGADVSIEGIPVAGRLDPLIMADMLARIGVEPGAGVMAAFRARYAQELCERLVHPTTTVRAMPGVHELVAALAELPALATLGLLTGNFAETGRAKIRSCGFDPAWFPIGVWGDDSPSTPPTRNDLPGVAMARYRQLAGRAIEPRRVVVIGDTPHDVACARTHGCRCLAVATGRSSVEELQLAGADLAVEDLADTKAVLEWLLT